MDIIDAHTHIGWDIQNLRSRLFPTEQSSFKLLDKMNTNGIGKAIIMPFPSSGAQFNSDKTWYKLENQNIIDSTISSNRFIPFIAVNPNSKMSVENVNTMINAYPIKGIKLLHENTIEFSIDSLIGNPIMKIVQDAGILFMIHIGTGREKESHKYHMTLEYAIAVAKKYPDIRFVFSHLGRLHENMIDALEMENVFMDTSGLSLQRNAFVALDDDEAFSSFSSTRIIENLVDTGFSNKIIWGSDEPYTFYKNEFLVVNDAEISSAKKKMIFYNNITKLL